MSSEIRVPENEADRVRLVKSLGVLDTPPEERFDRYTRFARHLLGVPIAFVSIIGEDTLWFKSTQGIEIKQAPRELSFCTHTIVEGGDMMVIPDTLEDSRFDQNPYVIQPPHIRFYAGVTLKIQDNIAIGTLCVCDTKPRFPSEDELKHFRELARLLEDEFETHALSTIDSLTGLSNRRGLAAIGRHALAMCQRSDKEATLLFLQLNDFAEINVEFGRETGDRVLNDVTQFLLNEFRHSDVVARAGPADFFVLLTGTSTRTLRKPLKTLEAAFRDENMNLPFDLTYRVGAVQWNPADQPDIEALMGAADQKLKQQSGDDGRA